MEDLTQYDEVIDKGILYDYVPFDTPRLATYSSSGDEYDLEKGGWVNFPKTVLVIGETKDSYITKLSDAEHGEWIDKRILYKYILPLGFHKTRLIKWEDTQLSLF